MFEFLWSNSCKHDKITPNMIAGYCPDCGEYVENQWYISRCECCGIKQKAFIKNGKVVSEAKFCKNCGSNVFISERLNKLDIVNINYAVIKKYTHENFKQNIIQTWIDKNAYSQIKLLPAY